MPDKILSADEKKPTEITDQTLNLDDVHTDEQIIEPPSSISFDSLAESKPFRWKLDWDNQNHRWTIFGLVAAILIGTCSWFVWFMFFQTHTERLTVQRGTWEYKIGVESFEPRDRSGWDYPPSDAYNVDSSYRYHYSRQVLDHYDTEYYDCGTYDSPRRCSRSTPVYRTEAVYDWYYTYTVDRWGFDHWIVTSGDKSSVPHWADLSVYTFIDRKQIGNERLSGERKQDYDAYFTNEKGEEKHLDVNQDTWNQMVVGATYDAQVNRVGTIRSVDWKQK